jgi:hypothetical protein
MKLHILIILFFVFCWSNCSLLKQTSPPIEISATQLIAEFEEHALAADKKYKGNSLVITSFVSHYALLRGTIGVYLRGDNLESKWKILCFIDNSSHPDAFSRLKAGQSFTFTGTVEPNDGDFFIRISNCKIE